MQIEQRCGIVLIGVYNDDLLNLYDSHDYFIINELHFDADLLMIILHLV